MGASSYATGRDRNPRSIYEGRKLKGYMGSEHEDVDWMEMVPESTRSVEGLG